MPTLNQAAIVPLVDLEAQHRTLREPIEAAALRVLRSGRSASDLKSRRLKMHSPNIAKPLTRSGSTLALPLFNSPFWHAKSVPVTKS
jgi:hypothetical protein